MKDVKSEGGQMKEGEIRIRKEEGKGTKPSLV